ncbi:MAG: GH25 family lysozyme, partial [Ruminiclostridium sp.]
VWNIVDDYDKVRKSGVKAVIVRNGYLGKTDDLYHTHMKGVIKAGMDVGTFTYIVSKNVQQARTEARETIERLKPYRGHLTYPVFCDMEDERYHNGEWGKFTKRQCTDIIKAFCEEIAKGGYYPALYINPAWLESYTYKSELVGKYDIWLAAWTGNLSVPTKYNYNQTMWQWGKGPVSGVKEAVDGDWVYIDYPAKIRAAGKNYLQPKAVKIERANDVYSSLGMAAIRSGCCRDNNIITRCEKGLLYPVDSVITVGGAKWISHAGMVGYSMLQDGGALFKKTGAYELCKTTTEINVRSSPQVAKGNELGRIKKGEPVYVVAEAAGGWKEIIYQGKTAYVSGLYLKKT